MLNKRDGYTISILTLFLPLTCASFVLAEETRAMEATRMQDSKREQKLSNSHFISEELFAKLRTYVISSPGFKNHSEQELRNMAIELETWEEPYRLKMNFPYYFAGYDHEDRPVWVAEVGKFKIRQEVELGEKNVQMMTKYTFQAIQRIIRTIYEKDTPEREFRFGAFILDYDGFDLYQLAHTDTVAFMLRVFRDYKDVIEEFLGYCILINVNHLANVMINAVRPLLGKIFERIDVYGTNKAKWIPVLRRKFPEDIIPSWYGGSSTFKPIQVHG